MDKKTFWKGYFVGILLTIAFVFFYFIYVPKNDMDTFVIQDLKGNSIQTTELTNGKPTVINIWATWCKPCVAEFPSFEEMNIKYAGKVNFLMISDEELSKIIKFKEVKKYNLNLAKSSKSIKDYGINSIPITYFYDKSGELMQT